MPSQLHEAMILLFRNRPALAPELLRDVLHQELPPFSEVRIEAADLPDITSKSYRADLVVLLYDGKPVHGIIVEVQLAPDAEKLFSWPYYAISLRARFRCQVTLFAFCVDEPTARWAARPIDLGGGNRYTPLVLGAAAVPVITDPEVARADPELAVLSAMAHGHDANTQQAIHIALAATAASVGLDVEHAARYFDLIVAGLGDAARKAFQEMMNTKFEYQSDFARQIFGQGKAEGMAEGKAEGKAEGRLEGRLDLLLRLLVRRFGPLPANAEARVRAASADEIDTFVDRVLSATDLAEVLAPD